MTGQDRAAIIGGLGVVALPVGWVLFLIGGEPAYCWRNPDEGYNVHVSRDCSAVLAEGHMVRIVAGQAGLWLMLAAVVALVAAAVLWVAGESRRSR
ncbi:hypothetical protein [Streptomyces triticirhizae]|uniref:Uncharacterized protein n=1 Tax=Streptomyces triticirhizae TaxID=2483353 RepID=A0A3M2M6F9_9ACTN|nr:hypothetical protein [Streptomyces triticirhizae]RMI44443.1 hypothetical protein EBN88_05430 [Streptomyces triticirhizae]